MIYILCVNPSIDCYESYSSIKVGHINRTVKQEFVVGGKGINLAYMFNNLGVKTKLITVLGGFTGEYVYKKLLFEKIDVIPVWNRRNTRINFKISADVETAFDVNFKKSNYVISRLKEIINELTNDDTLIISGSGYGYEELLMGFKGKIILDVNGKELKKIVKFKPYLVKPNKEELLTFSNNNDVQYSLNLLKNHADYVLCTLGEEGSILLSNNLYIKQDSINDDLITTVGCGDAFLATYLGLVELGYNEELAFNYAKKAAYIKAKYNRFPSKEEILPKL